MTPKKFPTYDHPMAVYTGIKTFKIKQISLKKENLYGCVEFPKYLLTVDPNQHPEDYKSTLLHEICHIGYEIFGLNDDDEIPSMSNEYLTMVTSNMVFQMAGLNPELFQFIFSTNE
mgnify:FL=1|tara:strand:- start:272 stop:619 length:348 start_codon:yes stop_codon:yes gene_type:complete